MIGKKCSVTGCSNISEARGWCQKHYMRFKRHGDVLFTRPSDWGSREGHPLYKKWHWLRRRYTAHKMLDPRWLDLWKFVEDVKEQPSDNHTIKRKDETKPFGPENWYWSEVNRCSEEQRNDRKLYMREWQKKKRAVDPEFSFNSSLKKQYGIDKDDYYRMLESQGGVCAICKGNEISVDPRSGKVRRLTVDHCHKNGTIRGLLCSCCNRGIGSFRDSVESLHAAINYLRS